MAKTDRQQDPERRLFCGRRQFSSLVPPEFGQAVTATGHRGPPREEHIRFIINQLPSLAFGSTHAQNHASQTHAGKLTPAGSVPADRRRSLWIAQIAITNPPEPPVVGPILRPFHLEKRIVSPPRLGNTPRLESLVRGGNLYLSVQDVIALVLENNLDIEIQRYGPILAREVERRSYAKLYATSVRRFWQDPPASVRQESV